MLKIKISRKVDNCDLEAEINKILDDNKTLEIVNILNFPEPEYKNMSQILLVYKE